MSQGLWTSCVAGNGPQLIARKETEILVLQIQELNTGNLYGHGKGSSTRASRKEHSPSNTLIVAE